MLSIQTKIHLQNVHDKIVCYQAGHGVQLLAGLGAG